MRYWMLASGAALALIGYVQATPGKPAKPQREPTNVALVDMAEIFTRDMQFVHERKKMTQELKAGNRVVEAKTAQLEALKADLKAMPAGTAEAKTLSERIVDAEVSLKSFKQKQQLRVLSRETEVYKSTYLAVQKQVETIAARRGCSIVMRFSRKGVESVSDPKTIISKMNKLVVTYDKTTDITDEVIRVRNTVFKAEAAVSDSNAKAKRPTVASFINKIPLLSTENKTLKSVQCNIEIRNGSVRLPFRFAWSGPDDISFLCRSEEKQLLTAFAMEKKMLIADVATSTAVYRENVNMNFQLRATAERVRFDMFFGNETVPGVLIDVKSFLATATGHKLEHVRDAIWKLSARSKSGKSDVVAIFDLDKKWPLQQIEVRVDQGKQVIAVRNIKINQPIPQRYRQFPDLKRLPAKLVILKAQKNDNIGKQIKLLGVIFRAMVVHLAVHDKKLRSAPFLKNVDWKQVAKNDATLTPALYDLFETPAPKTAERPKAKRQ